VFSPLAGASWAAAAIALQVASLIACGHWLALTGLDCFCPSFSALSASEQTRALTPFGQAPLFAAGGTSSLLVLGGLADPRLDSGCCPAPDPDLVPVDFFAGFGAWEEEGGVGLGRSFDVSGAARAVGSIAPGGVG